MATVEWLGGHAAITAILGRQGASAEFFESSGECFKTLVDYDFLDTLTPQMVCITFKPLLTSLIDCC